MSGIPAGYVPIGKATPEGIPEGYAPIGKVKNDSFAADTLDVLGEFAAGANRTVSEFVDFVGPDTVNALLSLSGSDKRMPTLTGALEKTGIRGGFMEPGTARDAVGAAGSTATLALGVGGGLRQAASKLPAFRAGESTGTGVLRTVAGSTPGQDVVAGALAGAGGEVGEAIGGPEGRLVGSVAAPLAPAIAKVGGSELGRRAFRLGESGRRAVAKTVDDFAEVGATPNLGQALDNEVVEGAQTLSSKFLGGKPLRTQLEATTNSIKTRLAQIADDISPIKGEESAGRVIQEGIRGKGGFVERFKEKSSALWTAVDEQIGNDTRVALTNTKDVFNRLVDKGSFGPVLNNKLVSKLSDIVDETGDHIVYSELKALRSMVGQRLSSNELISDIPRAELKQLYGAISEDIKTVARSQGIGGQYARANKFTKSGHSRLDGFVERIATKVDFDKIYSAVTRGGDGSQVINAFKRSLKPGEWEVVVSNVIRKLGRQTNSQNDVTGEGFSVGSFITQWNRLGPAKKALFSGSEKLNEYSKNLDTISRVAQRFKDDVTAAQNPSGSGQSVANTATMGAALFSAATGHLGAAAALVGVVAANNRAAALMASPAFVRWLAQSTRVSDAQLPAHIARLAAITSDSDAILSFLEDLRDNEEIERNRAENPLN